MIDLDDIIDPFSPAPEAALLYGNWVSRAPSLELEDDQD